MEDLGQLLGCAGDDSGVEAEEQAAQRSNGGSFHEVSVHEDVSDGSRCPCISFLQTMEKLLSSARRQVSTILWSSVSVCSSADRLSHQLGRVVGQIKLRCVARQSLEAA
jgi:hypothetical protein